MSCRRDAPVKITPLSDQQAAPVDPILFALRLLSRLSTVRARGVDRLIVGSLFSRQVEHYDASAEHYCAVLRAVDALALPSPEEEEVRRTARAVLATEYQRCTALAENVRAFLDTERPAAPVE
jgi:hypothetical protein